MNCPDPDNNDLVDVIAEDIERITDEYQRHLVLIATDPALTDEERAEHIGGLSLFTRAALRSTWEFSDLAVQHHREQFEVELLGG